MSGGEMGVKLRQQLGVRSLDEWPTPGSDRTCHNWGA